MTPWDAAVAANRAYLTPEDISDALHSGCDLSAVVREVLGAISAGKAEDASLCAFVAWKAMPEAGRDSSPAKGGGSDG